MEITFDGKAPTLSQCYEILLACAQYKTFLKKKDAPLKNTLKSYKALLIVFSIIIFFSVTLAILLKDTTMIITSIVSIISWATFLFIYLFLHSTAKKMSKQTPGSSIVTIDEKGIAVRRENIEYHLIPWENIYMIRIFKETTFVYPKENNITIYFGNEHNQEIIKEIFRLGKSDLIVK